MARPSSTWFENPNTVPHFPVPYDAPVPSIPMVAGNVQNVPHYVHNMSFFFDNARSAMPTGIMFGSPGSYEETSAVAESAQVPAVSSHPQGRRVFACSFCRKPYDRISRARDCENQDLGLTPHRCGGGCGNINWFVFMAILRTHRLTRSTSFQSRCL